MIPPFNIIIPARFASQRLPGKPLRDGCGKPLIQRVYECACDSSAESVTVATDDHNILRVVESFGGNACLTKVEHSSGTDRVAEVARILKLDDHRIVVNLQGDEPRMPGPLIDQVAEALGAHGEYVESADQIPAALERAFASGRPALVNVMIEPSPSPLTEWIIEQKEGRVL